jgi:hypothetical protein
MYRAGAVADGELIARLYRLRHEKLGLGTRVG